jgi:hypothetical protein
MTHSITPPPELVQQWVEQFVTDPPCMPEQVYIATRAAQWGADQEMEACIAWFDKSIPGYELVADRIRAARRPKPLSLKEQALALIDLIQGNKKPWDIKDLDVVRRALEALPND